MRNSALTTLGKKTSTTPGTGFQMVAPLAMEALQWPVKMLNGRMLNSPVAPATPVAASGVVRPPVVDGDVAKAVETANMATANKSGRLVRVVAAILLCPSLILC